MPVFKATQIPKKKVSAEDTLSIFCYHFQQYTYAQAKQLPFKRILIMIRAARKEQAKYMIDMLRVVTAANGGKNGPKNVLSYFEKIIEE